jgi:hypothetical protein
MIAASEEMHEEKLEFTNLIEHLNKVLKPRGIELKRTKWNPETDGSIEEFKAKLDDCEMCLTLYWCELAGNSVEELNTAYNGLKEGNNPRNLYVFFKEPTDDLTEALKDFKANFVTNYGHFFCKFENVDTLKLHFILQFEAYQNRILGLQGKLFEVNKGMVMLDGEEFVNLDNVPFAAFNKEYIRLQKELLELDTLVAEARARHKADPDNEQLEDELMNIRLKRGKTAEEFRKYQSHLYDIALTFATRKDEQYTERMRIAREQFEKGNAFEADEILNMETMKREKEEEISLLKRHNNNLEHKIEEFLLKAETVMARQDKSEEEQFLISEEAFCEAIDITNHIFLYQTNKDKYTDIIYRYAQHKMHWGKYVDALKLYKEIYDIDELLLNESEFEEQDDRLYKLFVTTTDIANVYDCLDNQKMAINYYDQAFMKLKQRMDDIRDRFSYMTLQELADSHLYKIEFFRHLSFLHTKYRELINKTPEQSKIMYYYFTFDSRILQIKPSVYLASYSKGMLKVLDSYSTYYSDPDLYTESDLHYLSDEIWSILLYFVQLRPAEFLESFLQSVSVARFYSPEEEEMFIEMGYTQAEKTFFKLKNSDPETLSLDVQRLFYNLSCEYHKMKYEEAFTELTHVENTINGISRLDDDSEKTDSYDIVDEELGNDNLEKLINLLKQSENEEN